jgi:exopolyphosphatase/guanosine-5'-triphosphate,3'-diphosphate pyrophosphatase
VSHVIARIAAMSYQERAAQPSIGRERADLVIAGCAILDAICRTWPVGRLRVADRGLREGILFNLMRQGGDGPSPSIST